MLSDDAPSHKMKMSENLLLSWLKEVLILNWTDLILNKRRSKWKSETFAFVCYAIYFRGRNDFDEERRNLAIVKYIQSNVTISRWSLNQSQHFLIKSSIICLDTRKLAKSGNTCTPAPIQREWRTVQQKNGRRRVNAKGKIVSAWPNSMEVLCD